MYLINRKLYGAIETIFLAADEEHLALSSTNVKEVAVFGGNIDFMVPKWFPNLLRQYKMIQADVKTKTMIDKFTALCYYHRNW